ncbi:MAG: complex I subunit 5 family protein [Microcella sp.]
MAVMWTLSLTLPLVVAGVIAALSLGGDEWRRRTRDAAVRYAWLAVVPMGITAAVDDGGLKVVDWMLFGTAIRLDEMGRPLVLLAVILYGIALAFVPRSISERPAGLNGFLLLCFTANVGVFVAANLVTFYLVFAAMSFLGYAIVVHDRTESARRAGAVYLVMTVFGESAVLGAFLLIASQGVTDVLDVPAAVAAADARDLIVALLIIGFGVKAGTIPLHVWLPLAHPAAPSPASAVLSGVMLKAGIVGLLRFLPLGEAGAEPLWGGVLVTLALVGGLLAAVVGVLHDNPKVILAYSSIGQMGFITALVGAALLDPAIAPAAIAAAVTYSVAHGLIKGALFFSIQVWDISRAPSWAVIVPQAVAALGLAGAPLTAGFIAKYVSKESLGDVALPALPAVALADLLPWFAVGSTVLLARFAVAMSRRRRRGTAGKPVSTAAWAVLALTAAAPVWWLATSFAPPLRVPGWFAPGPLVDQSWPFLLGIALALVAAALARRPRFRDARLLHPRGDIIPEGDIVVVLERLAAGTMRGLVHASGALGRARDALTARVRSGPSPMLLIDRLQVRGGTWVASGVLAVAALAAALVFVVVSRGGS